LGDATLDRLRTGREDMTCPRCHAANTPGAAACASCGFALLRQASTLASATGGGRRGLATASLVLGLLSLPSLGLLGLGAILSIVLGIVALVKANNAPAEYGGKGRAIVGIACGAISVLVMPAVLGIVAAIAIPSLLRARVSANEAAAIGDV